MMRPFRAQALTLFCLCYLRSVHLQPQTLPANVAVRQVSPIVEHGEGPHWDCGQQLLYAVDVVGQKVLRLRPRDGQFLAIKLHGPVTPVVPVLGSLTQLVVGVGRDVVLVDPQWGPGEPRLASPPLLLASVEKNLEGNRLNDGKADRFGRLWFGTMGPEPGGQVVPGRGSFYRMERDLSGAPAVTVTMKATNIDISNGLAWDASETRMYYIDTPTDVVDVFDYDLDTGNISNRRPVFDFKANNVTGHPDGMTIDAEGNLWIACFNGWQVIRIDPRSGRLLQSVPMPVSRVTSVTFGGPNLDVLYVTSMRFGLSDEELRSQPAAGSIFAVTGLGIRGRPPGGRKVQLPPLPPPPPPAPSAAARPPQPPPKLPTSSPRPLTHLPILRTSSPRESSTEPDAQFSTPGEKTEVKEEEHL